MTGIPCEELLSRCTIDKSHCRVDNINNADNPLKRMMPAAMAWHSWRLVWCHEHAFKAKHYEEARQLAKLSGACHGKLTCVKHATKLREHFDKHRVTGPWTLLVDFRGLVPCINLMQKGTINLPEMIIVSCQKPEQMLKASDRATEWVCKWMHNKNGLVVTMCPPSVILRELTGLTKRQLPGNINGFTERKGHEAVDNSEACSNCSNSSSEPDACTGNQQQDVVSLLQVPSPAGLYIQGLLLSMAPKELTNLLQEAMPLFYDD